MSVLEAETLVWLEAHAATTERLAATRRAGLLDDDLTLTIAATLAAAVDYALALPESVLADERTALGDVLFLASQRLPVTLFATPRGGSRELLPTGVGGG